MRLQNLSMHDLLLVAHAEVYSNPTISVYTYVDGQELRKPAPGSKAVLDVLDRRVADLMNLVTRSAPSVT